MAEKNRAWTKSVDDRIRFIAEGLHNHEHLQEKLPGLESLLDDYLDPQNAVGTAEDQEGFHRRLLQVFRDSEADSAYDDWLAKLTPDEQKRVAEFVEGHDCCEAGCGYTPGPSIGVREHVELMLSDGSGPIVLDGLNGRKHDTTDGPILTRMVASLTNAFTLESRKSIVVYQDTEFQNWGRVVDYVPRYTCIPSSTDDIKHIVKFAIANDMSVRAAGFRHSWAPIFGRNGQITISLLPLWEVARLPNFTALSKALPERKPNDLETIEVVQDATPRTPGNALVRIGVSTTNERLRRWCVKNKKYTYPLNVIMVEMTVGGTNAPICHGAGRAHPTLSDLVRKVEYIDCHGEQRTVEDPAQLKAASGCFGLMGVITHLTLEFQPMSYALMNPQKVPVVRAVPPPDDLPEEQIPPALQIPVTPEQRRNDIAAFEKHCADDYYVEYFWFPYADQCWVNNWNTTEDSTGVIDYPSDAQTFFMFISQFTMNVLQNSKVLNKLVSVLDLDTAAVTLLSRAAMLALPAWKKPVKTYLPDALHFQRGIQNVRVLDVEVEMPLLPKKNNPAKPDFDLVRKAWWDAILVCYKNSDTVPQRMPLEMRIMGGSEVIMAPQRGNHLGTCSIEVLTLENARGLWKPYVEEVLSKWLSYTDSDGKPIKTRPHWAKQWAEFHVKGESWLTRMKDVDYKDEIVEFKKVLSEIGKEHGWTLADLKKRFSNDTFDSLYFDDV
ncbi:hypothetical protein N0V93_004304 [Gnomoniopsis smithogilvyi]|uniref:FAD-binding PCMH-type domain-containing protein n=1 Tax=Gnomoniopsis smithogilvyi TaxID=1191159 RepID=A0A9W8YSC1_9PEZI|nr:hypothetical protein N0V93_004304 [Gnomoniopsis smithogilvyi]